MTAAADPTTLLRWMRSRRTETISARAISDAGPRAFRRRLEADIALATLIKAGSIVEVSSRPRAFKLAPRSEIAVMFDAAVARQRSAGRSHEAAVYVGGLEVRDLLRGDPRFALRQTDRTRCAHCGERLDGTTLQVAGDVLVHAGCVLAHQGALFRRINTAIVEAL